MFAKKTGIASISDGRSDLHKLNPKLIKIKDNWNSRDFDDPTNKSHIEELALSIAEIGVRQPLTVSWENGEAWLSDGECRLRAVMLAISRGAEIKTVPVILEDRYSNDADKLFSQIIRNSGKPFSQMEQAKVFKRLVDMGWQQGDIAKKAGVSPARISQILDLLTMPEPIKQMVVAGQVSASMAVATLKEHNGAKATQVLQDAVAVAQSEGKDRALPKHVEPTIQQAKPPAGKRSLGIEAAVKEAFEYADVDDSDDELVVIKIPVEQWEAIRKAC